ncbi:MAG: MarR family transcriptional regulator, partial [Candidatus Binataceae bacterium]
VDVEAERDSERWLIEAKGWQAANSANQQGAFNVALGQCLRRMNRPDVKYSVAFSDIPVYRGLWERLPKLARERTTITCLFVTKAGNVEESSS